MMVLLQTPVVEIGGGVLLVLNSALLLRLSYSAGGLVEKVSSHDKRIEHLELHECPHPDCPLKYSVGSTAK